MASPPANRALAGEGGGEDFVPDICDLSLASHAFTISDQESFSLC